jgi:hypothetical protein
MTSTWTPPSGRSTATTSRAPATAPPASSAPTPAGHPGRHRRVLHARQRTGRAAWGRGAERFVVELAGRVRRAGATGPLTCGPTQGLVGQGHCWLPGHQLWFSITVRQTRAWRRRSPPSPRPPGPTSTTRRRHRAGGRDHPRRGSPDHPAAPVLSAGRPACGRTGATTPWSPTAPAARPSWTPTPPSRGLRAGHPRPQGWCRAAPFPSGRFLANPAWLVLGALAHTCWAGRPPSGSVPAASWSPRPSAAACWRCPAG